MSRTIDERVVEMRFDNKEFESRAKQSIGTLTKLKEALNLSTKESTTKGLEQLSKASQNLSLDGITAGVEALQKRFSTLGIVGMRAIENITDSMMGTLGKGIHFVTDSIVSGGIKRAMNIENAHFQLQALLKDEAKVQAVMADAMESVDGTAYAYDEAAKAAAQFAASGLQAGEEMLGALKGITGVAAMTNSDFESISQIFTTVAGNGRLMGDQLLQLSSRGLNAASTIADYFREVRGQANITEADIREMVTKGKLDFKTFADAMTYAFGDSAKRANETFTGALSNMKSALARIGAGFISPLVEQNSEMVKLFNALREQINSVKSSLVFDEQKSALSGMTKQADLMVETISSLARDGTVEFDQFTTAILGASKSEEELARSNQALSESYNKVKENGSATLDTLIDFKKNGINASEAVREYVNGVLDGSIKASDAVKESVKEISGGTNLIIGDVTRLAKEGKISYDIFTNAIVNSSGTVTKGSELVGTAVESMMSKIKESGTVTAENLVELNQNGMNAAKALYEYISGVADGSIRASYSMTQAVQEITDENGKLSDSVIQLAKDGKISYDMLQSAMQETYGDQRALSKQFTDFFLDSVKSLVTTIQEIDMTKPMEVFYHWVDITKNVLKGFLSVLKPIASAFSQIFLSFSADDVINFSSKIESFTAKLRLSERGSKNLRDTFKGLFSVAKLVLDVFVKLVGIFVPIKKPIGSLSDGILSLTGAIGRSITSFTEWVRKSSLIRKSYEVISNGVRSAMESFSNFMGNIRKFAKEVYQLKPVQELIGLLAKAFQRLGDVIRDGLTTASKKIVQFGDNIRKIFPTISGDGLTGRISELATTLLNMIKGINNIDLSEASKKFTGFQNALNDLLNILKGNNGLTTFVTNMKEFFENLTDAFSIDVIMERMDNFRNSTDGFVTWIKGLLSPLANLFADFSLGGALSAAGGFGIMYGFIKVAKSFEKVTTTLEKIPDILGSIKGAIAAYQNNLKADTLKKVATSILILSGALVLLSFADTERVMKSAVALTLIAGVLMAGVNKFVDVAKRTKTIEDVLDRFGKAANNLAKGVKWKAIGSAFKSFATSILIIIGSIGAVYYMYKKDPDALTQAGKVVGIIGSALIGFGVIMTILSGIFKKGSSNFSKSAFGILALSSSLFLAVSALNRLFNMTLPTDWQTKVKILAGIFVGLGVLSLILGRASKQVSTYQSSWWPGSGKTSMATSGAGSMSSTPILALAAMLYVTVLALERLFKMSLPDDAGPKIAILAGIFFALGGIVLAVGYASKLSGGALKATGTILAMCAFLVVAVGALMILSIFPGEKLIKGAVALGIVLGTLAAALWGAGKISSPDAYKSIFAMALMVGAIVAALGVLSMIKWTELLKAGIALGGILIVLAIDFATVGKITNQKAWLNILSMVAMVVAVSLSLYQLANQPWERLISAGTAISAVLLSMAGALKMVSTTKIDAKGIAAFALGLVAVAGVAYILFKLADQPWEGLLGTAVALSTVLLSMSGVLAVCAIVGKIGKEAGIGILLLDALIADILGVLLALGKIYEIEGIQQVLADGGTLLNKIGEALGGFFGSIVGGFGVSVSDAFPKIGENLTGFMNTAKPFFDWIGGFEESTMNSVKYLAEAILVLTAGSVLEGLTSWLTGGSNLISFGQELADFAPYFVKYSQAIDGKVNAEVVEASANAALALAEMARKLPNSGGLAAKIFGDNSLSEFGEELVKFGPRLALYAKQIANVNPEVVQASANAAQVLSDMATKLPNSGGLAAKIFGDNTLSSFGKELSEFGPYLRAYAISISGLNGDVVANSASAAMALAELANTLPNSGGLVSWFSGDNDIGTFGESLVTFGHGLYNYYESVQGIEISKLEGITQLVQELILMAQQISTIDSYAIVSFSDTLAAMATLGLNAFTNVFVNSGPQVNSAIQILMDAVLSSMSSHNRSFLSAGATTGESWINGIKSKYATAVVIGATCALKYLDGIKGKYLDAEKVGKELANKVLDGAKSVDFYAAGKNATEGFTKGINSSLALASAAGKSLGQAAYEAARKALDEHSPSKKMAEVGEYAGLGFVAGLMYLIAKAGEAGEAVGNEAVKGASDAIENISRVITDDMFSDPVIRPTVDLSSVQRSVADVNKLFNQAIAFSADNAVSVSGTIAASRSKKSGSEIQNQENSGKQIIMNYEQNNYSPKALNSVEIYRQTKNMMSMAKGAINNA